MTSTFAPPSGPPVTDSSASSLADADLVPVAETASGGRRRPFALVAAVVAVAALGVAAFVALAGGGSGDGADIAEPYSLIAAAESTITASTVEFDLTVSASDLGEITVSGAVDNDSQLVMVTTDVSSLLGLGDTPMPFGGGDMTVLVDGSAGVIYLDASALGGFLPDSAGWVSIDLGALAEQSGQALDDLQDEFAIDPTDIARSLLDTDNATEVGIDTIDGVEVKHYEVSVDIAAALAAVPQADLDPALADIDLPDTVTYDVWVTADNQLRRVSFGTEIAGQTVGMQLDMTTSSESLGVELPADGDVFDLTGLLGF
ncbi:MAG TPA: hypothetical protein VMY16_08455 [Ilumatobacteraceae bacterium]|nr:hypothetical protein [Ilumatobacteraceae bacterium]